MGRYFICVSGGRCAVILVVSFSNSPPDVPQSDAGHEHGDGEVTSVPFTVNNKGAFNVNSVIE